VATQITSIPITVRVGGGTGVCMMFVLPLRFQS
jgi:hypothetical protein